MKNLRNDSIKIAYAPDDNYAKMCLVSMISVAHNTKENLDFIILHSSLGKNSIDALNEIKKYSNCTINYQYVDEDNFENTKKARWVTVQAQFRSLIPDLLPAFVDKCIYFDCDILLNGDIKEFWDKDVSNNLVAAVSDVWNVKNHIRRLGLKSSTYFNSGVLLMNLSKCRQFGLYRKFVECCKNDDTIKNGDQDILNKIIDEDKTVVSPRYNFMEGWWENYYNEYKGWELDEYNNAKINPLIIHYTGYKPFIPDSHHSMKELWWKYARKTSCYDAIQEKNILKEIFNRPLLDYDGVIPVLYISDEDSAIYTLTSLVSILENTNNVIDATIIDLGIDEQTKKKFHSLNYKNFNLNFIEIDNKKAPRDPDVLDYLVFNINDVVSKYEKVIYLDSKTLLNGDIQEFYNYNISNVLAAGVLDVRHNSSSKYIRLGNNRYFSCKVMLLNAENLRKSNLLYNAIECKKNNPNMSEQDILNKIINEDKILVSPRYNYIEPWWRNYQVEYKYNYLKEYEKAKKNPLIINFTGYSPDYTQSAHPYKELWWKYFKKTDCYINKLEELRLKIYTKKKKIKALVRSYKNKSNNTSNEIFN